MEINNNGRDSAGEEKYFLMWPRVVIACNNHDEEVDIDDDCQIYIYIYFPSNEALSSKSFLGSTMSSIKDRPPFLAISARAPCIVTMYIACLRRTTPSFGYLSSLNARYSFLIRFIAGLYILRIPFDSFHDFISY